MMEEQKKKVLLESRGNRLASDHPYKELFAYEKPVLRHPAMDLGDRAKIFSPFAALTGHEDAIIKMQEVRENRRILSESEQQELNRSLMRLVKGDTCTITYFSYDPGSDGSGHEAEGRYEQVSGVVKKIDQVQGLLIFEDGRKIPVAEITGIE